MKNDLRTSRRPVFDDIFAVAAGEPARAVAHESETIDTVVSDLRKTTT